MGDSYSYFRLFLIMCQMIVAIRRITATRAIFEPRRFLICLYHLRIAMSKRSTLTTACPSKYRTILLPCLVIEPSRCVASPELRQPGVKPQ